MPPPRASAAKAKVEEPPPILGAEIGQLVGHELIRVLLARMIAEDRLPQALLFAGPPLLGKRSFAVGLAKCLLSPRREGSFPGSPGAPETDNEAQWAEFAEARLRPDPETSRRVARAVHLDVSLIAPEKGSKIIRIDQVRALQDWAWISPSEGARKVALIFGADTISEEAANSFLKILEEPPPSLSLILVSDFPHRLLDTVRSRCTACAFHPLPARALEAWLAERHDCDPPRARLVAGLAEGRPGLALALLRSESLGLRRPLLAEMEILRTRGFVALPGVAARCLSAAGGLRAALEGLLLILREAVVLAAQPPRETEEAMLLGGDLAAETRRVLGDASAESLLAAADAVVGGLNVTRHLYIPSELLVLENVLADVGIALRRARPVAETSR